MKTVSPFFASVISICVGRVRVGVREYLGEGLGGRRCDGIDVLHFLFFCLHIFRFVLHCFIACHKRTADTVGESVTVSSSFRFPRERREPERGGVNRACFF